MLRGGQARGGVHGGEAGLYLYVHGGYLILAGRGAQLKLTQHPDLITPTPPRHMHAFTCSSNGRGCSPPSPTSSPTTRPPPPHTHTPHTHTHQHTHEHKHTPPPRLPTCIARAAHKLTPPPRLPTCIARAAPPTNAGAASASDAPQQRAWWQGGTAAFRGPPSRLQPPPLPPYCGPPA